MAKKNEHTFLLNHGGTGQVERDLAALAPENFKLNDFSIAEWMEFAHAFAKEVRYFGVENDTHAVNNWQQFFVEKNAIKKFLSDIESTNNLTPHLTLFICFLKLLETTKSRFNGITKRHLDFYYSEILQIDKKAPVADHVHLIFEIAKNISETKIDKNKLLEAGKDNNGKRLQYATDKEVVINKAQISDLKSVYHHLKQKPSEVNGIYAAPAVNSLDGNGEPFKETPQWLPFGYPKHYNPAAILNTPKLGFAVASPTLNLQEGKRDVLIKFTGKQPFEKFTAQQLSSVIEVYATGEKGWLGPFKLSTIKKDAFITAIENNTFQVYISIDKNEGAITNYSKSIHGENFNTNQPVFRFLIQTQTPTYSDGYNLYTQLRNKNLIKIDIEVSVAEAELLQLSNDLGDIKADKPFYPFGTQPIKNSSFTIDYPEAFSKQWSSIELKGLWLNTPLDFKNHYLAYRKNDTNRNLTPLLYHNLLYKSATPNTLGIKTPSSDTPNNIYVDGNNYFNSKVTLKTDTIVDASKILFTKNGDQFKFGLKIDYKSPFETSKKGPLKIALNQSFLHKIFPQVYALALTNQEDTLLPNEPYTPLLEKLYFSYMANQVLDLKNSTNQSELAPIQLFQEHPFGQTKNNNTLVPNYTKGGELYIGLENTQPLQQVQILFQLLEGTENPLAESFVGNEKIKWSVLSGDLWMDLGSNYLLGNTTDNFLKTGIVSVIIPNEATKTHTLLPPGKVWLRAKSDKSFDAVCKFIDIKAQVITATFKDNGNDLSHLENGIPAGTISKLTERNAHIKNINQPFGSFGGTPEETSPAYYQRVSERLRHKDRAINLWDYEHLILEEFKEVYKVKCLPHTLNNNFNAAGHVAIVVVPDTVNQNAYDIFQPRLSTAKRNEIQNYINALNTLFVEAQVINPDYEEIKVTLNVKFNTGYDEFFYINQLEEDIKKYLSPWAYKETSKLRFGVTFHRSKLIAYLEHLDYVDYLDSVVLLHLKKPESSGIEKTNIKPSSAKAILVSAKKHSVTAIKSNCETNNPLTKNACLPT
ncbi:baseplate J/gp47 family protein [Algibacter pacificus]|uniref:baseplate J/gp47 family protein n=1 Tax=Algibacter pacificus TaxID=2599389 RepID=UPI0011CA2411|nr:baseplate J/gp47 family protein [Algibacter pacificus]